MIKDLLEIAISEERRRAEEVHASKALQDAEKEILKFLSLEPSSSEDLLKLRAGEYDAEFVEIPNEYLHSTKTANGRGDGDSGFDGPDVGQLFENLNALMGRMGGPTRKAPKTPKRYTVVDALAIMKQHITRTLVDENAVIAQAKIKTEQEGKYSQSTVYYI
jgi:ATP-dependent protease HslVU (ClpYQ) ATPase subunit